MAAGDAGTLQRHDFHLSERDVARVRTGQPVVVFIEPLNTEVDGRVVRISPQATIIGGDVVYPVLIDLDERPPELRWGMSVDVEISGE